MKHVATSQVMTDCVMTTPSIPERTAEQQRERPESYLRRTLALAEIWRERLRGRRALALMDERSLRDIGLTPYDASYEARKLFWRE